LLTFPLTVGAGKRLFAPDAPPYGYELLTSRATSAGATYVELRPTTFTQGLVRVEDGHEVRRAPRAARN
jgi:hypothetical protein